MEPGERAAALAEARGKSALWCPRCAGIEGAIAAVVIAKLVDGDLLEQPVEVIVNAWNRNVIPWWLLLPQGVSGAIKRRAGTEPFRELARHGAIPLGEAVTTGAGRLPFRFIIHVAGINLLWRASQVSIRDSVRSALRLARAAGVRSLGLPLIGAGSGGWNEDRALALITETLAPEIADVDVTLVRYRRPSR